ncbi:MAG TPA: hypothetical protein VF954_04580, partial [Acidimicrobiales bacterium]
FEGVSIDAALTPADPARPVELRVAVRGLRVEGKVLPPVVLDPARLDRDVVPLLQNLLQDRLGRLAGEPGAPQPLRALAEHLLPLVGLGGDVPRLPVEGIGIDPSVVARWFTTVLDSPPAGGGTPGSAWLGHLAGLLGSGAPVAGTGAEADPYRVLLATFGGARVDLTLATRTAAGGRDLLAGVALLLGGPAGAVLEARGMLLSLPLTGPGPPRAVPSAAVTIRAPGDAAGTLVAGGGLGVRFVRAGLAWDGIALGPILELGGVEFEGASHELINLSNVDSIRAAAAEAARASIAAALGTDGPGSHLAVLVGLIPPPGEPGAPVADLVALLSAPTRELARVHRSRLHDAAHSWATMLAHLAALLGLPEPVAGTGSPAEPWHVPVAKDGPLTLELAAWTGDHDLHLGLRAVATPTVGAATIDATMLSEVVHLTFPDSGPTTARLLGRHQGRLAVTGPFTLAPVGGIGLTVQGGDLTIDWSGTGARAGRDTVRAHRAPRRRRRDAAGVAGAAGRWL